ncbi:hypothetical protein [[Phormidium ambiguum] IAM M-71]|nr:hypothetical protein [Phormidium ambiguum]
MSISNAIKSLSKSATKTNQSSCNQRSTTIPTIKLVTNCSALRATDRVDWGKCGKEFDFISSPLSVHSSNGIQLKVSSRGTFLRLDAGSGLKGKFKSGDKLLFLEFADSAITIDFSTPVFGIGTQIQRAFFGAFTGIIEAFDTTGKSLGRFKVRGNDNHADDDIAPFIGVISPVPNISRITLYVPENGGYGFTINELNLVTRLKKPILARYLFLFNKNRTKSVNTDLM